MISLHRCCMPTLRSWRASPVLQRRAKSLRRHTRADQARAGTAGPDLRKGFSRPARRGENIVAPGLKARCSGSLAGIPTNILGNRDGEVLDDPQSFDQGRIEAQRPPHDSAARALSRPCTRISPPLVRINYYPPRGDNKEGWEHIASSVDEHPMQIKINFLCRDSIPAPRRSRSIWRCSPICAAGPGGRASGMLSSTTRVR